MMARVAWRSLRARPIRTIALAAGFGFGIGVMAALLGVGEVILDQATAPALRGGGDLRVRGADGDLALARWLLRELRDGEGLGEHVRAAAPRIEGSLFLRVGDRSTLVRAAWGVPSLDRALGDRELDGLDGWRDGPGDAPWAELDEDSLRRAIDRFHPAPSGGPWDDGWAEWLYFNGKGPETGFYLTWLCGAIDDRRVRPCGIRLQWERGSERRSFGARIDVPEATLLDDAPEFSWGPNRLRLVDGRYALELDLVDENGARLAGTLSLDPDPGAAFPPYTIRGADGWMSGYVVPALRGEWNGTIAIDGRSHDLRGLEGYHDHNWGHWRGVTWQWGQVAADGVSVVYGRVFAPPEAVDPSYRPAFLVATLPDGDRVLFPRVLVDETDETGTGVPERIDVRGRRGDETIELSVRVTDVQRTRMPGGVLFGGEDDTDFLQMKADYSVDLRTGRGSWSFDARGAAETFRGPDHRPGAPDELE